MLEVKQITAGDAVSSLVADINQASWDAANEMCAYEEESLATYLAHPDTVFVSCYEAQDGQTTFMGMGSGRLELKPYDGSRWLYVDEVDVCADQRQKGAGAALMQKFIAIAEYHGCEEVWLGTEVDNDAANALYRSLDPDDEAEVVGYTWETD